MCGVCLWMSLPTTTRPNPAGEENVTMVRDRHYAAESILVHEFAHAVMCAGPFPPPHKHAFHPLFNPHLHKAGSFSGAATPFADYHFMAINGAGARPHPINGRCIGMSDAQRAAVEVRVHGCLYLALAKQCLLPSVRISRPALRLLGRSAHQNREERWQSGRLPRF